MKDYRLTIQIPLKGYDNLDARMQMHKILEKISDIEGVDKTIKLQEIFPDKAPEGVKI